MKVKTRSKKLWDVVASYAQRPLLIITAFLLLLLISAVAVNRATLAGSTAVYRCSRQKASRGVAAAEVELQVKYGEESVKACQSR